MASNPRKTLILAILSAVAVSLVSCGPSYHTSDEHYVLVAANVSLPYWQDAKAGFLGAAREMKVKADFVGPASYLPDEQLKAFQNAVAQNPSGILVSPARPAMFDDAINQAMEKGIPVITIDSDSPQSKRIAFIGTDNYRAGLTMGKLLVQTLHGNGSVAVLTIPGQYNLDERLRGLQDAIKTSPYLSVQWVYDDKGDSQTASDEINTLLTQYQVKAIVCLEASGGPGAARALDHAGKGGAIPIIAMDADPETLSGISKSLILATVAQKPYTMAFYGLRLLDDLHHNAVHQFTNWRTAPTTPIPSIIDTGTTVVNSVNVDDYRNALVSAATP